MKNLWAKSSNEEVRAGNGLISLSFARKGNSIVLKSIGKGPKCVELLAEIQDSQNLWELQFRASNGELVMVSSAGAQEAIFEAQVSAYAEIIIRWHGIPVGNGKIEVEAKINIYPDDPISHWSLKVTNDNQTPVLWSVNFPIISNVCASPTSGIKLAFPTGWGLLYNKPLKESEMQGTYPSAKVVMQFIACWRGRNGLYLGAHDPTATHKQFVCKPNTEKKHLRLSIVNFPSQQGSVTTGYDLPYKAAVAVFNGDWYEASKIYRNWAINNAPWTIGGELQNRQSTPEWLKDIDIWCLTGGPSTEVFEPSKQFAAYFGVPSAVHWYNWHEIPFDDHYPEYFPTKEGFMKGINDLQKSGIRVMPYINGRLWDPRTTTWTTENAHNACAKDEKLSSYEETYGQSVPLVVMCPYTEQWQEKVNYIINKLINEYKVDGVYIDQISAAPPKLCFDPNHGHATGGGDFWVAGYRKMLKEVRQKLPQGTMLTTEESADPWVDLLDAFLMVNTPPGKGEIIPLFPAVYSGRTITFGFQYFASDDLDRRLPFRMKMARAFVWGAQLGWIGVEILQEKHKMEAEYLKTLAQCRRRAHKFLTFGRMLKPIALGKIPSVWIESKTGSWRDYRIAVPSVISSTWQSNDGEIGIAITNITDESQTISLNIRSSHTGLSKDQTYLLSRITGSGSGEQPIGETKGIRLVHKEVLLPRSAIVLRISLA